MAINTFTAYYIKEHKDSVRNYNYLVLGIVILIMAIVDPLMLKLLPVILKGKGMEKISEIMTINPETAFLNYVKDCFQISLFAIVFLSAIKVNKDLYANKFVMPLSKGASPQGIIIAKNVHLITVTSVFTILGYILNYYYIGLLFEGNAVPAEAVLKAILYTILLYGFYISLGIFYSTFIKSSTFAAFIIVVLVIIFPPLLMQLDSIAFLFPNKFSDLIMVQGISDSIGNIISSLLFTVLFIVLSIVRFRKSEFYY